MVILWQSLPGQWCIVFPSSLYGMRDNWNDIEDATKGGRDNDEVVTVWVRSRGTQEFAECRKRIVRQVLGEGHTPCVARSRTGTHRKLLKLNNLATWATMTFSIDGPLVISLLWLHYTPTWGRGRQFRVRHWKWGYQEYELFCLCLLPF